MKLTPPFPINTIDNPFGPAAGVLLAYYETLGIKGHPGIDFNVPWGTPIPCAIGNSVVSALLSQDNPNLMAFRAVNTIYEDETGCYEIQYGHVSSMNVKIGQTLNQGDVVANVGNTGDVFTETDGVLTEVSEASKLAGSHAGAHLHFQVRIIVKELATGQIDASKHYLNDGIGELILDGYRYYVPEWDNGYDGCVDPTLFFAGGLEEVVKDETQVANTITDSAIKETFEQEIVEGAKKLLGIDP